VPAPSEVRVGTAAETADAVTRSHLPDGRVVGWYGDPGVVIDAEVADATPPTALVARFGAAGFWERWTAAECAAKLADVPMHLWLREHGLAHSGALVETIRRDGLVLSVARAVTHPTA
jgi:hypothetical protein